MSGTIPNFSSKSADQLLALSTTATASLASTKATSTAQEQPAAQVEAPPTFSIAQSQLRARLRLSLCQTAISTSTPKSKTSFKKTISTRSCSTTRAANLLTSFSSLPTSTSLWPHGTILTAFRTTWTLCHSTIRWASHLWNLFTSSSWTLSRPNSPSFLNMAPMRGLYRWAWQFLLLPLLLSESY